MAAKDPVKFEWVYPQRDAKYRWGRLKSAIFDQ